ncbi:MAG: hypothetical protein LBG92_10585 [Prevotellaceae bacterium]|jgi:hypothetical protein|nr:hypothetical protein [Prevotellaceae bacterium]
MPEILVLSNLNGGKDSSTKPFSKQITQILQTIIDFYIAYNQRIIN